VNIPPELHYTAEHEWVKVEGNTATIGITDYAQGELGDVIFVNIDAGVGDDVVRGETFGSIEAVKDISDMFSPVSGKVIEVNPKLDEEISEDEYKRGRRHCVNESAYEDGWLIKVELSDESEISDMLDAAGYEESIG
jgi:glycine cleavage system H protein